MTANLSKALHSYRLSLQYQIRFLVLRQGKKKKKKEQIPGTDSVEIFLAEQAKTPLPY